MKTVKDKILEKLVFNKHTKAKILVDIKEETCFTQKEIDEIRNFSESCKIKPIIITNQICDSAYGLVFEKNVIFIHFYNEWKEIPPYKKAENIRDKEEQIITIRFEKSSYTDKYYYNALSNKNNWLYSGSPSVQSCEEAKIKKKNDLKETILEKLVFNKHTKAKTLPVNVDITDDCKISDIDKNKIIKFAESLKVKPNIITNFHLSETNKKIYSKEYIYLYFSDDYKTISPFRYDFPLGEFITNFNNIFILQYNYHGKITYNVQINIKGEISDKRLFEYNNNNLDNCLKELKNQLDTTYSNFFNK